MSFPSPQERGSSKLEVSVLEQADVPQGQGMTVMSKAPLESQCAGTTWRCFALPVASQYYSRLSG